MVFFNHVYWYVNKVLPKGKNPVVNSMGFFICCKEWKIAIKSNVSFWYHKISGEC